MTQDQVSDVHEVLARMSRMELTIDQLNERIRVLERLAAHDEAKLSAEIEKLRSAR